MPMRGHQEEDHSLIGEALDELNITTWGLGHCGHAIFLAFYLSEAKKLPNLSVFAARISALWAKEVPSSEWCRYNTGSYDPEEQLAGGWIATERLKSDEQH
jgi:hypothetical protein